MNLPEFLQNKIELELAKVPLKEIQSAYDDLSHAYRKNRENIHLSLNSHEKRLAYLAARMPATYAAVCSVLQQLENESICESLLDVGAGSGTAAFAACELFESLNKVTAVERNSEMIKIGVGLAGEHSVLKNTHWINADMLAPSLQFPRADLVILSYALNEILPKEQEELILKLWNATNKYLVIVEPGSKDSFQLLHSIRSLFIPRGHTILAPCPHANICPAFVENDFCHFSARVQRTSFHKFLKHGERGFEDEKFSYLIFTKIPKQNYEARVVRRPALRPGLVTLKLCTENGFTTKSCGKKNKEFYKIFKNSEWGDKIQVLE
ncbi:MAG: small ribosomal subunit Rsm22 family protein [Bdellovibrionota bacterium]